MIPLNSVPTAVYVTVTCCWMALDQVNPFTARVFDGVL